VGHIATSMESWQFNGGLVDDATHQRKQANNILGQWIINFSCTRH